MKKTYFYILIFTLSISITSCKKFLDAKPDKSLVIPSKLTDLQAIIDNDGLMNQSESDIAEVAADNFYITPTFFPILAKLDQDTYTWNPEVRSDLSWIDTYLRIYSANLILDNIDNVSKGNKDQDAYNSIKGSAYFIRGYSLFVGTQIYTMPYNKGINDGALGMPIKTSSDINSSTSRATLKETYNQIVGDLKLACSYLPIENSPLTRPNKAACYLLLSNAYLQMQEYELAKIYSDSCLSIKNKLMDFNSLDSTSTNPIPRGNSELLFESTLYSSTPLNSFLSKADSNLYKSYASNDLRKVIFYTQDASFKGGYDNNYGGQALYSGASVDEAYLIKAECAARLNNLDQASSTLNSLLVNRYKTNTFNPYTFTNSLIALKTILQERRKELAFRGGRRWWDLRRLNLDPTFATTLRRNVNGAIIELPPNDLRYAYLIPEGVVAVAGVPQNAR